MVKKFITKIFEPVVKRIPQRFRKKRYLALVLAILFFVIWQIFKSQQAKFDVTTAVVQKGNLTETISASGEVNADNKAELAFQTSGKLAWVGVKEGDEVKKWQSIASLDKTQLELTLKKYLSTWESQFTTFDDTSDTYKDSVLTDAVRRIKERSQNNLDQTQIDVDIQNEAIKLATLYTPIAGIVTKVDPPQAGVNVSPLTASYEVVDPKSIYFDAEVNEVDIVKLSKDQKAIINLDAYPGKDFESSIQNISFTSVITSTGGTAYNVKLALPVNENLGFRLGMGGDANFVLNSKENVLMIPTTAVVEDGDKNYVWTVDGSSHAHKKDVTIGISSVNDVEITSGLNEGNIIIERPPAKLTEGDKVKVS